MSNGQLWFLSALGMAGGALTLIMFFMWMIGQLALGVL